MSKKQPAVTEKSNSKLSKALIVAVALMLICVIGFHLFFPLLGIAIVMSAGAWGMVTGTIVIFCIGIMMLFMVPGILLFLLCLFAFGWTILAIVLFPFIFPLVMPLLIILVFIAYVLGRNKS